MEYTKWKIRTKDGFEYETEKDFADKIATEQVFISNAGHINSESGYDTFEDIVSYL